MRKRSYYFINAITFYRLAVTPVLMVLIFKDNLSVFKWMLALSFLTDLVDGALARYFKVSSVFGSKLDSVADDLTIVSAITGVFVFRSAFVRTEILILSLLFFLFILQNVLALIKYRKTTSFHTYAAKTAAILQGLFFILLFFLAEPLPQLFYAAALATAIDLLEEIVLVVFLPRWKSNVKGLYWVLLKKKNS